MALRVNHASETSYFSAIAASSLNSLSVRLAGTRCFVVGNLFAPIADSRCSTLFHRATLYLNSLASTSSRGEKSHKCQKPEKTGDRRNFFFPFGPGAERASEQSWNSIPHGGGAGIYACGKA